MSNSEMINAAVQNMAAAMKGGNLEAVLAAYEPTAALVPQPGMQVIGEAFVEAIKGFTAMKPDFQMPRHEVIEAGDIALHIAPWTLESQDPATGNPVRESGLSVAVFRRQPDGSWLMVIDNPYGSHLLS